MIIIIPTIKYGSTHYDTFTMGVCSNYHGYFFQCISDYIAFQKYPSETSLEKYIEPRNIPGTNI